MLYEITNEVRTRLEARGVPARVVYGPERTQTEGFADTRIVLEHVRGAGRDSFDAPRGGRGNPGAPMRRNAISMLRIYARDESIGAGIQDHERLANAILDQALVALWTALRVRRHVVDIAQWSGGFAEPEAMDGTEAWPGALYELTFPLERLVFESAWSLAWNAPGAGRPTKTITGGIRSRTNIDAESDTGPGPGAETACNAID